MKRFIQIVLLTLISISVRAYYFECKIDCYDYDEELPLISMQSTSAAITSDWYDRLTLDENGIARYPDAKPDEFERIIRKARGLDTGDGDTSIGRDLPLNDPSPLMLAIFVLIYILCKRRTIDIKDKTS